MYKSDKIKVSKTSKETIILKSKSKALLEKFLDKQMSLQEKQMNGEKITEEEVQKANEIVEKVQKDSLISKLMEEEYRLNTIINEISGIITKPLEELYSAE